MKILRPSSQIPTARAARPGVRRGVLAVWLHALWITAILAAARAWMQAAYLDPAEVEGRGADVLRAHLTGLRFDLRIACVAAAPLLLCLLAAQGWGGLRARLARVAGAVVFVTTFAVAALALVNHYYYATFHAPIDLFLFALGEDQPGTVLGTVVSDYPAVRAAVAALLLAAVPAWWTRRLLRAAPRRGLAGAGVLLLQAPLLVLAGRSSLGTFPLQRGSAQVSDVATLNALVPNGPLALYWALRDRAEDAASKPASLRRERELEAQLGYAARDRTPENPRLAARPPHVVVALMESLGANMLAFDDPARCDLLGRLRPRWQRDFVFPRFLPGCNGTAPSLMALLFQSPIDNVSRSSAQGVRLAGAPFDVYAQAGYRTVFVTPGNLGWRRLGDYLRTQGVEQVLDENALADRYPEAAAQRGPWGLPDEFAFRCVADLLQESERPVFAVVLTVSNHPPVALPATYAPGPADPPDELVARLGGDREAARETVLGFQYASDALGAFLDRVEPGAPRPVVVAATGDHYVRHLAARLPQEHALDRAVPLYLHVPREILELRPWRMDPARPGSHKDVFPTLYALSLSGAEHIALGGRDLLAVEDDPARAFGHNTGLWIDGEGAQLFGATAVRYAWAGPGGLLLAPEPLPADPARARRIDGYWELLRWHFAARVRGVVE